MLKKYNQFLIKESVSINDSEEYWKRKGKIGKKVMIYTHDDLDGIMSCILMKEYLENHGFEIVGYGIINYTEGWKIINLDKKYINICLDFAEDNPDLDLFMDHHGQFDKKSITFKGSLIESPEEDKFDLNAESGTMKKKSENSVKTQTMSAYDGICTLLGIKTDHMILDVINMVDSAAYKKYDVSLTQALNFDLRQIKNRLEFAAAFNQLIKRSDFRTLIEVIHNSTLSIFKIYHAFKILYPNNNLDKKGVGKGFVEDAKWRLDQMSKRTIGYGEKKVYWTQSEYMRKFWDDDKAKIKNDGFQLIGNLAYIPSGTWANPIRACALLTEYEYVDRFNIKFIMLQYGNTLQLVTYEKISEMDTLPVINHSWEMDDLNKYTRYVHDEIKSKLHYQGNKTVSGGHTGIGTISNIVGICHVGDLDGCRFLDIVKNTFINDLSGVRWRLDTSWGDPTEQEYHEIPMNSRVLMVDQLSEINW